MADLVDRSGNLLIGKELEIEMIKAYERGDEKGDRKDG